MSNKNLLNYLMTIGVCLSTQAVVSQRHSGTEVLDSLISQEHYEIAQTVLKQQTQSLTSQQAYYHLADYIYYTGKITLAKETISQANKKVTDFVHELSARTDSLKVLRQAQLELSSYWELVGDSKKSYEANLVALKITGKWKEATPSDFGLIENNLGVLATRQGNIAQGLEHLQKSLKHYKKDSNTPKDKLYILYNSLGGSLWYVSKIDSALYYYKEADKALQSLEKNPVNNYYRPAFLHNNIAAIYSTEGNLDLALESMRKTIDYLNKFIASDVPQAKKEAAKEFLYQAIENYAGIYKDMGNLQKAKDLLMYVYKEKQKAFDSNSPELFKAKVLLGQIYLALKEYVHANKFLDEALLHHKEINGGNAYWAADAHYYKAILNDELGHRALAKAHFLQAENLYEQTLEGAYDELYLDFIRYASHFYATNNEKDKALSMSKKSYNYIKENQGSTTSFEIQQTLNLGDIHYQMGEYDQAETMATLALGLLKKNLPTQTNPLDSTKLIFYKPHAILLKTQASYQLQKEKDIEFLKSQFSDIRQAISLVEKQKILVGDERNVSILIENNGSLFEFAKQLALELYQVTNNTEFLFEVLSLHESILYNRIRSRLNSKSAMVYANLPDAILQREKAIKKALKDALQNSGNMDAYFQANNDWNEYLDQLKKDHPKYYQLRFASIYKTLKDTGAKLPEHTTAVRYSYIQDELYAIIISTGQTALFKLPVSNLGGKIAQLQDGKSLFENQFGLLSSLYNSLWKPFEDSIHTEHVIIIPDRDLFNLNFEMLTSKKIASYAELSQNSLLSKHIISYNYSLFLLDTKSKIVDYADNFVAFVPEFDTRMKENYKMGLHDSIHLDKTYLTLLPQPFTKRLAETYSRIFDGTTFLNERSTEQVFKTSAKEHKIIHIGTHAESNNISPELSRLVFAKPQNRSDMDDNYLYTYEIYTANLSSNLAILTACETGKPTYQAGEGMISLAHAFNYAGSESILTSLWKIDEQSSAQIIQLFYDNIREGMAKDKALQQAKLSYIGTAKGRTIHPQYWAGLVLIGDTSPIVMQTAFSWWYWGLGGLILLLLVLIILRKNHRLGK
ncbi:MAG TPA: CHAT domain-containing tetratricopeptide repeat protein [Aquaticitalea sp.]|nr:CHAT domain-containing tetratricopeptide repeat protein [Aquaticitalea sp.]